VTGNAHQVLTDCAFCLTEAAVLELVDPAHPACHFGIAASRRCRMCQWQDAAIDEPFPARLPLGSHRCPACQVAIPPTVHGEGSVCPGCGYAPRVVAVAPPLDLTDRDAAIAALRRWADEEGDADVEQFCLANMGASSARIIELLGRHEKVPTTFDVIAYLFPTKGAATSMAAMPELVDREPAPPPVPAVVPAPLAMDPRTPARVLVSVMVADGDLRGGEAKFVHAWLAHEGLTELGHDELRVWRPHELGPMPDPALRDRLIEACVHLMHLDRVRDGSEWKVIQTFARAWGVPDEKVAAWDKAYDRRYSTAMTRLWRSLTELVRVR
jgi:hypothetical protein